LLNLTDILAPEHNVNFEPLSFTSRGQLQNGSIFASGFNTGKKIPKKAIFFAKTHGLLFFGGSTADNNVD
jgi:hypothetical protein